MNILIITLITFASFLASGTSSATIFTYTDEAQYLAKPTELNYATLSENFEGATWDSLRTPVDMGGWIDTLSGYTFDETTETYIPKGHMFLNMHGGALYDFGAGGDADPNHLIRALRRTQAQVSSTTAP